MSFYTHLQILLCFVVIAGAYQHERSIHDKIYATVENVAPCIRRLNGTHSFGCTSDYNGNVGIVQLVKSMSDIDSLRTYSGVTFIILLYPDGFKREMLEALNSVSAVSGVVLLAEKHTVSLPFSMDDTCPNRYSGLNWRDKETCDLNKPWNSYGSGLFFNKWNFPIFTVTDNTSKDAIHHCYKQFNQDYPPDLLHGPRCAIKMRAHMYAGVDSRTCLRRSENAFNLNPIMYCEALGGKNIYFPLFPMYMTHFENSRSLIVVAAKLDATSFFYDEVPASLTTATSVVTLLATAKLLHKMLPYTDDRHYKKNVLFILFNGESYDYIGSSRVVYDMSKNSFPYSPDTIHLDDIGMFIEISQIQNSRKLFSHYIFSNETNPTIQSFMHELNEFGKKHQTVINADPTSGIMPPSSLQSFLRHDKKLPGMVLSSYNTEFSNKYYNSMYDDATNLNYVYANGSKISDESIQALITNVSIILAESLYQKITDTSVLSDAPTLSYQEVDELLHCFIDNVNCGMLPTKFNTPVVQPNYYVSVPRSTNIITTLTTYVLAHIIGRREPNAANKEDCYNRNSYNGTYFWLQSDTVKEYCVRTMVNYSEAVSPAFVINGYDLSITGEYSTWTESIWRDVDLQIFLTPSRMYTYAALTTGFIISSLSFLVAFLMKYHME